MSYWKKTWRLISTFLIDSSTEMNWDTTLSCVKRIWIYSWAEKAMLQPKNPTKYNIKILKIVVKSTFATKKILKMFTKKKQKQVWSKKNQKMNSVFLRYFRNIHIKVKVGVVQSGSRRINAQNLKKKLVDFN